MTEGRPLQRDEKAIAIVNIINSRNNRKRVDPSFPFLALSTLSQQVIKRWEERERDKEKECDNDNQLISLSKGFIIHYNQHNIHNSIIRLTAQKLTRV